MRKIFQNKTGILKNCHIYQMLNTQKRHLSFHTPGHKRSGWDITELGYSDNLSTPTGCIARAETDIARILGAEKSFILTDGSTAGVLAMLYAFAKAGLTSLAIPSYAHKSVTNGCKLLKITPIEYTRQQLFSGLENVLCQVDGLLLVSPDYYGNIPDLQAIKTLCKASEKPLLIDGAHGGHLHYDNRLYAGSVADMWVDGVHKSLPALTQGAVVSAKSSAWSEKLSEGVDVFRTTSPSYPIMASVEYAVKYPRNDKLEQAVKTVFGGQDRITIAQDWTKVCVRCGKRAFDIQTELERLGIYAEFCDGDVLMFYLSPATKIQGLNVLCKKLKTVVNKYPYIEVEQAPAPTLFPVTGGTEQVKLDTAQGRVCARDCGLFPPCTPLIQAGERITEEKLALLKRASNVYGIIDGKITVLKNAVEE